LSTSRSNLLAFVLLLVAAVIIGAMFVSLQLISNPLGRDFCPSDGPSGVLVIGIDATDILSEAQRLDVTNRLETAISGIPTNWRVEVWNVAPTSGIATITGAAICKPEVNVSLWTANPRKAQQRFTQFMKSVNQTLAEVLSQPASSESPILESVQAVGLRSFGAPEMAKVNERRLILVSDLVQNTRQISFTKSLIPYQAFRLSKTFDALRAPLAGAQIEILFLSRPNSSAASALIGWWQQYFADTGASIASVQRIVG
jgi:hypothetical protein